MYVRQLDPSNEVEIMSKSSYHLAIAFRIDLPWLLWSSDLAYSAPP